MNVRLLPLLAISASALFALKVLGLSFGSGTTGLPVREAVAQEAANAEAPAEAPADGGADAAPAEGEAPADGQTDGAEEAPVDEGAESALPESMEIGGSAAERAVLESLGKRRQTLDEQRGQLDLREKLLQATEERIDKRVEELKALEQRIDAALEAKKQQEENEVASLVVMYESMKPKDAARIFNRLNLPVLLKVVRQMKPKKMADILGKMDPEAAERLTVAIASNGDTPQPVPQGNSDELPKIQSN